MGSWMIYGANGYTATVLIEKAVSQGETPILAGRSEEKIKEVAELYALPYRVFPLDNHERVVEELTDIDVVVNCAGPFVFTGIALVKACVDAHADYLDISGEIEVFQDIYEYDGMARKNKVKLVPGTGFDIAPTDLLLTHLKQQHPEVTGAKIAIYSEGKPSIGTSLTTLHGVVEGGRILQQGEIKKVNHLYHVQNFTFNVKSKKKKRLCMTVPLPDIFVASQTLDYEDLQMYSSIHPKQIKWLRMLNNFKGVLNNEWIFRRAENRVIKRVVNPDKELRSKTSSYVVIEGYDRSFPQRSGKKPSMKYQLTTHNSYDLTADITLAAVERCLQADDISGFLSPTQLLGDKYLVDMEGVTLLEIKR